MAQLIQSSVARPTGRVHVDSKFLRSRGEQCMLQTLSNTNGDFHSSRPPQLPLVMVEESSSDYYIIKIGNHAISILTEMLMS